MRLLSGLWLLALILFNPLAVETRYVGGEPPNQCAACGCVVCNASKHKQSPPAAVRQLPNSIWSGLGQILHCNPIIRFGPCSNRP